MTETTESAFLSPPLVETGYDPIEDRLRANVRATIETMFEEELAAFLGRLRYGRGVGDAKGYRHGHRERQLTGTFGAETCACRGPGLLTGTARSRSGARKPSRATGG
jgi:putative transposase